MTPRTIKAIGVFSLVVGCCFIFYGFLDLIVFHPDLYTSGFCPCPLNYGRLTVPLIGGAIFISEGFISVWLSRVSTKPIAQVAETDQASLS